MGKVDHAGFSQGQGRSLRGKKARYVMQGSVKGQVGHVEFSQGTR